MDNTVISEKEGKEEITFRITLNLLNTACILKRPDCPRYTDRILNCKGSGSASTEM